MDWRARIKKVILRIVLNGVLLGIPTLYGHGLVRYETNLNPNGAEDLLYLLGSVDTVEGDVVECGSSRCGSSVIMGKYIEYKKIGKKVLAHDSFQGFDLNELQRERREGLTSVTEGAFTSTSLEYVSRKIARLGLEGRVVPVKGFFEQTLPKLNGNRISFTFIDCDLRNSLLYCAETLWPRLSKGGCMAFDDYGNPEFKGARSGIDEFIRNHESEIGEHGIRQTLYFAYKR